MIEKKKVEFLRSAKKCRKMQKSAQTIENKGGEFALGGEAEREAGRGGELFEISQLTIIRIYRLVKKDLRKEAKGYKPGILGGLWG